jgi:hypothetical protein
VSPTQAARSMKRCHQSDRQSRPQSLCA